MEPVLISASPRQLSKLRNGHKVRVKKGMTGSGFNLLVNPARINPITRAFDRDRAIVVQLTPEELQANKQVEGSGIFGKQFDREVKKAIGKKAAKKVYKGLKDVGLPITKVGTEIAAPVAAAALISTGVPAPVAIGSTQAIKNIAQGYLEDPQSYQEKEGKNVPKKLLKDVKLEKVLMASAKPTIKKEQKKMGAGLYGSGLYPSMGGTGLYAGRTTMRGTGVGYLMGRGALLNVPDSELPPALQSQSLSANYSMSTQLPPPLASIIRS
jgi:hypothetical protein